MTTQLLIYEQVVPITAQRHGNWSIKAAPNYEFARKVNSVPLTAVEFMNAAAEYAIVFTGNEESVMPAVVLGIRNQENLYLKEDGSWNANYIPAFIRRYPFVFSSSDEGQNFTLCIDEEYVGCNQEGRGERLFDAEGERTQYLASVLEFLKEFQVQFQRTQLFCKKLKDLNLLEPMRAQVTLNSGQQMALGGFMIVSRERVKALPGEVLAEMAKTDELELLYLHLHSIRNLSNTVDRLAAQSGASQPAEEKQA